MTRNVDVLLVGGGVMSATLATLLHELEPTWTIEIVERLPTVAAESSNAWNNAGTGHSALCELNYSPQRADGTVDVSKAIQVNEQFQISRQFWSHLVRTGVLPDPGTFITATPHLSFVTGEKDTEYLRARHELLKDHPLFAGIEFTDQQEQLYQWAPLMMIGRPVRQKVAATFSSAGTDVNFGALTTQLFERLASDGVHLVLEREVTGLRRRGDGWRVTSRGVGGAGERVDARFVFVGAGGGALSLLQRSRIREIRGFGGFPVSGQFFKTSDPAIVARHKAKVYGKAAVGAPPMSVPHLDTRVVDGGASLLFGPFAGFTPKFQKLGSYFDLFGSIRPGNLIPMISVGFQTLGDGLLRYLIGQVLQPKRRKFDALREFMPSASMADWELITAGQRVQVIRPNSRKGGELQFGTEVIAAADGSIAGLLGASPGASTAAPIMLSVLERCFGDRMAQWLPTLTTMVPSWGTALSDDPELAERVLAETAETLGISR